MALQYTVSYSIVVSCNITRNKRTSDQKKNLTKSWKEDTKMKLINIVHKLETRPKTEFYSRPFTGILRNHMTVSQI